METLDISAMFAKECTPQNLVFISTSKEYTRAKDLHVNCKHCDLTFSNGSRLALHRRVEHNGERFTCEDCGKVYKSKAYLKTHLRDYHSDTKQEYTCVECGKVFNYFDSFRKHVAQHKDGTFECSFCKENYTTKSGLKDHVARIHEKKRFPCELCDKTLCSGSALALHRRTEHSEEKFQCGKCGKSFSTPQIVKKHEMEKCPMKFAN